MSGTATVTCGEQVATMVCNKEWTEYCLTMQANGSACVEVTSERKNSRPKAMHSEHSTFARYMFLASSEGVYGESGDLH